MADPDKRAGAALSAGCGPADASPGPTIAAGFGDKIDVDPTKVDALKGKLEDQVIRLQNLLDKVQRTKAIDGPGPDPHTARAMNEFHKRAAEGDGCYATANKAAQQALLDAIDKLEQAKQAYTKNDQGGANALGRSQQG